MNIGLGFFGGIILARLLAPDDFGTFALALSLYALFDVRSKLQLEQKFLRDRENPLAQFLTFFSLNLSLSGASLILAILAALVAVALQRADLAGCLVIVGLVNVADSASASVRLSIEKEIAFGRVALIQSLSSLVQFTTTAAGAIVGLGLWSLPWGLAAGTLVSLVIFLRIAPHRPRFGLNPPLARGFLAYGARYGLVFTTATTILTQCDNLIVALFGGTGALGFYDRAYRTALWPTVLISTAIARISLPTYAKLQDDQARFSKAVSLVLWVVMTCATPIAIIFVVTAPDLVPALYGAQWTPSIPILQALAAFALFRTLWEDTVSLLVATGRSGLLARLAMGQAVILILIAIPLTYALGPLGTAISVGLVFLIPAIFLFLAVRVWLNVNLGEAVFVPILNNLLMLALYLVIRPQLPLDQGVATWLRWGIEAALAVGLYALVSLAISRQTIIGRARYIIQLARG
ncbi:MAG: oligosaccharide flippase family protein [Chloroflexi bacterium]|nr:oligosaccharide flippase family protein [Chloroflexota bacterium]